MNIANEYRNLAYILQVESVFCAILLVPLSPNILHYSPVSKTRWRLVMFTLRKNFFSINEVAMPDNTEKATKFSN